MSKQPHPSSSSSSSKNSKNKSSRSSSPLVSDPATQPPSIKVNINLTPKKSKKSSSKTKNRTPTKSNPGLYDAAKNPNNPNNPSQVTSPYQRRSKSPLYTSPNNPNNPYNPESPPPHRHNTNTSFNRNDLSTPPRHLSRNTPSSSSGRRNSGGPSGTRSSPNNNDLGSNSDSPRILGGILAPIRPNSRGTSGGAHVSSRPGSRSTSRPSSRPNSRPSSQTKSRPGSSSTSPAAVTVTRRIYALPSGATSCSRCQTALVGYIYQCTHKSCHEYFLCRRCNVTNRHGVDVTPPHTFEQLVYRPGEKSNSPKINTASPLRRASNLKPMKPITWPNH